MEIHENYINFSQRLHCFTVTYHNQVKKFFRMLQTILSNFFHSYSDSIPKTSLIIIIRGAVFCIAMALWGSEVNLILCLFARGIARLVMIFYFLIIFYKRYIDL